MEAKTVDAIITAARAAWPASNNIEITLEANPTSVEAARFAEYADCGVNRVSVGIQALNDGDLKTLGRLHSVDEAKQALEIAKANFQRFSFDLIYARQNQSLAAWERELSEALKLAEGHLSLYQLTIEPNTAFGDRFARGRLPGLPSEDLAADMFELTQEMTRSKGLLAYEVSNHAYAGFESQHNLIYWRGHDWIGVGPGAHGRYSVGENRFSTIAFSQPGKWLEAALAGSGDESKAILGKKDALEEQLMMGLRLSEGVQIDAYHNYMNKINKLSEIGMLEVLDGRLRATPEGRPVLNAIIRELLT